MSFGVALIIFTWFLGCIAYVGLLLLINSMLDNDDISRQISIYSHILTLIVFGTLVYYYQIGIYVFALLAAFTLYITTNSE